MRVGSRFEAVAHARLGDDVLGVRRCRLGSRLRQQRRRSNREFDLTFEVTAHEPPRRHTVKGTVFGVDTTMEFTFEPRCRHAGDHGCDGEGSQSARVGCPARDAGDARVDVTALQAIQRQLGAPWSGIANQTGRERTSITFL